jgi:hypothetical protein
MPASAAARRTPFGFFGVVMDPEVGLDSSPAALDAQMGLMAKSGVESVRTNFDWETAEPAPGLFQFQEIDSIVRAAAEHHLELLPIVEFTPKWASSHPSSAWDEYAPTTPGTYATFMTTLVDRYGPRGSFWAANPRVPKVPIRDWQIWNEPEGTKYDWRSAPWPSTYTKLLKAAYKAVHRADHGATVVSGAVVGLNTTTLTPWAEARDLYRAGAKRFFDVLAVNAFTNSPSAATSVTRSIKIVTLVRQVMRQHGDRSKPIWVTELTWTAAQGKIPRSDYAGFETTPKGQAQRLTGYYNRVAARRPDGIQRAFWYTWESSYTPAALFGNPPTFQYTGLVKWLPGQPFAPLPLLSTYAHVAAKFEGCRKSANARACA